MHWIRQRRSEESATKLAVSKEPSPGAAPQPTGLSEPRDVPPAPTQHIVSQSPLKGPHGPHSPLSSGGIPHTTSGSTRHQNLSEGSPPGSPSTLPPPLKVAKTTGEDKTPACPGKQICPFKLTEATSLEPAYPAKQRKNVLLFKSWLEKDCRRLLGQTLVPPEADHVHAQSNCSSDRSSAASRPAMPEASDGVLRDTCRLLLSKLKNDLGIKVLAFDLDNTIIRQHSGGYIDPSEDKRKILDSISEDFVNLAIEAVPLGLKICVVTFSDPRSRPSHMRHSALAGKELLSEILARAKKRSLTPDAWDWVIDKVYPFYPQLYQDSTGYRRIGLDAPMAGEKRYHLERAREDFQVHKHEIAFFDDDIRNCKAAADEDVVALWVSRGTGITLRELKCIVSDGSTKPL